VRTRRIPWGEAARTERPHAARAHAGRSTRSISSLASSSSGSRWRGQLIGGLVVLLALGLLYHTQESGRLLSQLESYLTGQVAVTQTTTTQSSGTVAGPPVAQALSQELQAAQLAAKGQDWQLAQSELQAAEASWASLEAVYGKAGVSSTDLNGFTADLANLALAISQKNAAQVTETVQNAQKSLAWMTTNYVSGSGPTFQQMSALVQNLDAAAQKQDWPTVQQDAKLLEQMMQSIQQGF